MNNTLRSNLFFQQAHLLMQSSFIKITFQLLSGVIILAFASQLSIPFDPVPLTFQSTTVILLGIIFGARKGISIVLLYLIAGLIGLPVFEGFASGLSKCLGPTAGYLFGFLPAVWLSGYFAQAGKTKKMGSTFLVALSADSLIFLSGITILSLFVGIKSAFLLGFFPFLSSELIKLIAIATVIPIYFRNTK